MEFGIGIWVAFNLFVLAMLALDLGVFHRHTHEVSVKEAAIWSVVWVTLSMTFNAVLYFWQGSEIALQFFTGYLIEKSLSVDNIFVFVLIFGAFAVPKAYQHRILFWGILGALVMRGALIFAGAALLDRFHWIIYIFGAFLVFTGIRMAFQSEHAISPEENKVIKFVQRFVPVAADYKGDRFFLRRAGKLIATPLFLVLVLVESTDLVFAVDSIPAIFAVTQNPFIVYTSNVFAILGLRAMYFLLAGVMDKFVYLKVGLAAVLTFVGIKMLVVALGFHIPTPLSLVVIIGILAIAVIASLIKTRNDDKTSDSNVVTTKPVQ